MASRNAADAQSMIDTADGALGETHSILLRMRELAVQASTGTLNSDDNAALDAEFQQLEAEIDRINDNTTFAGTAILQEQQQNSTLERKRLTLSHTPLVKWQRMT